MVDSQGFSSENPILNLDTIAGISARKKMEAIAKSRWSKSSGGTVTSTLIADDNSSRSGTVTSTVIADDNLGRVELTAIQEKVNQMKSRGVEPKYYNTLLLVNGTRNPAKVIEYRRGSNRVKIIEDLNSGRVIYEQYGTGRGGGGVRQLRGVSTQGVSASEYKNIENDLRNSGLNPIKNNRGQVIGFFSPDTKKSYAYSVAGIKDFERDSGKGGAIFRKYIRDFKNQNGMSIASKQSLKEKFKVAFSTPAKSTKTLINIAKLLTTSSKLIPIVLMDYGLSVGKGAVKVGLYAIDEVGYVRSIKYNIQENKFYIPSGTRAITDKMGKVKKWVGYNFKTNPLKDPDYQTFSLTTAFALVGVTSSAMAVRLFGVARGVAIWEAVKNPTPYNIAVAESMFLGTAKRGIMKTVARRDILIAKTGELVPLKERIKQVDFINRNAGRVVETVTAKPSSRAKYTNVQNKNSPDYTFGKPIEFVTYKVGQAYPTSEIFISGKGTKLQKILKTGIVNIEKVFVSLVGKKYNAIIKKTLLSKGKMSESFIKKYYSEIQLEANRRGVPVLAHSPKRLRGFFQAEQEAVKILPFNYKPKKLKFAGVTSGGNRVFSDEGRLVSLKRNIKSKFQKGKIERSYFQEITKEKLTYLKGRKAMKGEYAEHGIEHLSASNVDSYAQKYAQNMIVRKFGNIFKQHDLAKVSDQDSFVQFEHGQVLYDLWRKGKYPDKSIYKIPKNLQKQIMEAYAGHTPVKPRLIETLLKGWKDNSITQDLIWYAKNKRNPILQDILTLDRIELPRAGRWNFRVNYRLLDKNAIKRIYGSELNAVKNIRFLNFKTVPKNLISQLGKKKIKLIMSRDKNLLRILRGKASKTKGQNYGWTSQRRVSTPSITKSYGSKYKKVVSNNYALNVKRKNYSTLNKKNYSGDYSKKKITYKSIPIKYKKGKSPYKPTPSKYKKGKVTSAHSVNYGKKYERPYSYSKKINNNKKITLILPRLKIFTPSTLRKSQDTFYVVTRKRGKLVKLYPKPLTLKDAKDYLAHSVDNNLTRSAWFVPLGKNKKVVRPPKNIQGYFSKSSMKLRPYKIRMGKKKQMLNGYIEKRKYFQDTTGERRQLKSTRRIIRPTRRPIRKISSAQRRVMLSNLKRARLIRMRNLKRR